jgi:asparagine synthase (glutamine-hydrolysing)
MSGLVGLINIPSNQLNYIIKEISSKLHRFEWETWDWWTSEDRTITLGRVDIGVFNPKPQPAISSDQRVLVFLSGELYRTSSLKQELETYGCKFSRNDDPEIILNAYLIYGIEFIHKVEGVFHLVILDRNQQELLIANDRFGLRPLYYSYYQNRFSFAPEVKALIVDPDFNKRLNYTSMAEYMRFQVLLGDKTFFENILLLPPASLLKFNLRDKKLSVQAYWSFNEISPLITKESYQEIVEESARLFQESVDLLGLDNQYRTGLYITGGLDSRLIAGCLAKKKKNFPTISYGVKNSIDVVLAEKIAKVLGSDHHFFEFRNGCWILDIIDLHIELTEGHHSWIHSHGMSTLPVARSKFDINLTGWALGGILGGHWSNRLLDEAVDDYAFECHLFHFYNQVHTYPGLTEAEEYQLYDHDFRIKLMGVAFESLCNEARRYKNYPEYNRAQFFHLNRNRRLTQNFVIFNGSHFENRFPGHDYQFFNFIYSLPPSIKADRRLQKDVIDHVNPHLSAIPSAKDRLAFSRNPLRRSSQLIITRLKQRTNRHIAHIFNEPSKEYADYELWLQNDLNEWAVDILTNERIRARGMFNIDFIESLLRRNRSGQELFTIGKIAPIMTFEMMMQRYFD